MSELYAYIDESGTFPKERIEYHRYFSVGLILTDTPTYLNRVFSRNLLKLIKKHRDLSDIFTAKKEIKGSEVEEHLKTPIYEAIVKSQCSFEIGVIVADLFEVHDVFRENSAIAFNYLIKLYIQNYMNSAGIFNGSGNMKLFIDERNVATKLTHQLAGYLDAELVVAEPVFKKKFFVSYWDSKTQPLIQLADFVANSVKRTCYGDKEIALKNLNILRPRITNKSAFYFPKTALHIDGL